MVKTDLYRDLEVLWEYIEDRLAHIKKLGAQTKIDWHTHIEVSWGHRENRLAHTHRGVMGA